MPVVDEPIESNPWFELVSSPFRANGWVECTDGDHPIYDKSDVGRVIVHSYDDIGCVKGYQVICRECAAKRDGR